MDGGDRTFLPDGRELADYLATQFNYPEGEVKELLRVSQYASVMQGRGPLYLSLQEVFDADYRAQRAASPLSRGYRRSGGRKVPRRGIQLILTTNYDDAARAGVRGSQAPYDLVTYVADGEGRGGFVPGRANGRSGRSSSRTAIRWT